jgi:hypothetical protein
MAKQQSVTLVDDLDGGKAAETVRFGIDGVLYEIDLGKRHAAALRKALRDFVAHARRVRPGMADGRSTGARGKAAGANAAQVREWARDNGVALSARGRIPAAVMEQYLAAAS